MAIYSTNFEYHKQGEFVKIQEFLLVIILGMRVVGKGSWKEREVGKF